MRAPSCETSSPTKREPGNTAQIAALSADQAPTAVRMSTYDNAVLDDSSWGVLLVLALHRQSRVFLWRRVILFDHEFYRHAVQLLEQESAYDHRVRH